MLIIYIFIVIDIVISNIIIKYQIRIFLFLFNNIFKYDEINYCNFYVKLNKQKLLFFFYNMCTILKHFYNTK